MSEQRPDPAAATAAAREFQALRSLAERAATAPAGVLHVAADRERLERARRAARFFAGIEALALPGWDCLPYDRAPPSPAASTRRAEVLARLAGGETPPLVLVTAAAFVQRLPPRQAFANRRFTLMPGECLDTAVLAEFLRSSGYALLDRADEPGEAVMAADRVDVFPPACAQPVRLEIADGRLSALRRYDPVSQRSADAVDSVVLLPASELMIEAAAATRFRNNYRALFGDPADEDPLHSAVAEGRRHPGAEHWLPLFYDRLETLADYLPDAEISLDDGVDERRDARIAEVRDAYEARRAMRAMGPAAGLPPYHPVPPESLFLDGAAWTEALAGREVRRPVDEVQDVEAAPVPSLTAGNGDNLLSVVADLQEQGRRVLIGADGRAAREGLVRFLRRSGLRDAAAAEEWSQAAAGVAVVPFDLPAGFASGDLAFLAGAPLAGQIAMRRGARPPAFAVPDIRSGDLVIHADHGLAMCEGLESVETDGRRREYLRLEFKGGDKLLVPVEALDMVWRYGAPEDVAAKPDKLGGTAWRKRRERAADAARAAADDLVRMAAARLSAKAPALAASAAVYRRFAERFPHAETDDQRRAITATLADLSSERPMDRIVCGDVGFGKTEVALRAAFVAATAGRQVAVVVPTTPLCRQHCETFTSRFAGFPLRVVQLSRAVPPVQRRRNLDALKEGTAQVVVATQALFSDEVAFRDLGLLVVDEEQRLGVRQKEQWRDRFPGLHTLTLTATPIPRTLRLALAGLRDLSVIATPPLGRRPVRTFLGPFDPVVLRQALLREYGRGGQSFVICARLADLPALERQLSETVPGLRVAVAHGRLSGPALDEVMCVFADGGSDVLLATNIVEAGLDIPNANTLLVHKADLFGLAQLHQLRGRVGRSTVRAYAYLTHEGDADPTPAARRRLETVAALSDPGAGFAVAARDLDLRGGGNLVGEEQAGHLRDVGAELFLHLLRRAVAEARGLPLPDEAWVPEIDLGLPAAIPPDYVTDPDERIGLYRRIAKAESAEEAEELAEDLADRFGEPPPELRNLLRLPALRRLCRRAGLRRLECGPRGAVLRFAGEPEAEAAARNAGLPARRRPDAAVAVLADWPTPDARLAGLEGLLGRLAAA